MTRKVCEVLLDVLAPISTRQFFGMTGDTLNPLLDAIRRDGRFEWMGVRHEEIPRPDPGHAPSPAGPEVHGDELPERVARADLDACHAAP